MRRLANKPFFWDLERRRYKRYRIFEKLAFYVVKLVIKLTESLLSTCTFVWNMLFMVFMNTFFANISNFMPTNLVMYIVLCLLRMLECNNLLIIVF